MRNSGQIFHFPTLTFLLGWDPLNDKIEPFPDGGQEGILHLQDDVIPGPPLQGMEDMEAL